MADPIQPPRRVKIPRRYLLDPRPQLTFALLVLTALGGIGLLYASAVYFLADTGLLGGRTVAEVRSFLLMIHTAYFVVGGAILFVTVVLLTHRFVGPAYVIQRAVEGMRRGDFSVRLELRKRDCHRAVVEQLGLLRDELAEREDARQKTGQRLERCLDAGDTTGARACLQQLLERSVDDRAQAA